LIQLKELPYGDDCSYNIIHRVMAKALLLLLLLLFAATTTTTITTTTTTTTTSTTTDDATTTIAKTNKGGPPPPQRVRKGLPVRVYDRRPLYQQQGAKTHRDT